MPLKVTVVLSGPGQSGDLFTPVLEVILEVIFLAQRLQVFGTAATNFWNGAKHFWHGSRTNSFYLSSVAERRFKC